MTMSALDQHAPGHVVVVGMHRSGTSAVANSLFELGLGLPVDTEMIGAGPSNEKGHWESRELARFDESVLRYLGGTWSAPPAPEAGWESVDDPELDALRIHAAELATRAFSPPPMVIKDPRLCITLPLWRSIFGATPCAVLVAREPLSVARSLQARDGFPITLGLALWERYVRQSLATVTGMPVFVLEYRSIVESPRTQLSELAKFLNTFGVTVPSRRVDQAVDIFQPDLRHHREDGDTACPSPQLDLMEIVRRHAGFHEDWSPPALPDEPEWISDVIWLAAAGQSVTWELGVSQTELKWIKRSRLFRASRAFWRTTGTGPVLS
jgi:hypothetical protein